MNAQARLDALAAICNRAHNRQTVTIDILPRLEVDDSAVGETMPIWTVTIDSSSPDGGGGVGRKVVRLPQFRAGAIPFACLELPDAACFMKGR